jgi:tRNA(Ile)-lysidine synthase
VDRAGPVTAGPGLTAALAARCTFPPAGTQAVCAVSGGADSLALLLLAVAAGCRATAVHVDHGLRPGSAAEADAVAAVAEGLGAGFRAVRADVDVGPNLEARARAARYAALPPGALTGHTADDRAETVLINLLRGTGPDGLAGIRPSGRRPMLALRRHETVALCAEAGLVPFEDPSNRDRRFLRNRVRHELLPMLSELAGRDVVPLLCRQADHAGALSDLVRSLAEGVDPTDARALRAAEPTVAATAVREWLRSGDGERHPPDAAAVARVLAVARGERTATEVGGGRRVRRSAGRLTVD